MLWTKAAGFRAVDRSFGLVALTDGLSVVTAFLYVFCVFFLFPWMFQDPSETFGRPRTYAFDALLVRSVACHSTSPEAFCVMIRIRVAIFVPSMAIFMTHGVFSTERATQ